MAEEKHANQRWLAMGVALLLLLTCVFSFLSWLEWRSLRNAEEESRRIQQLGARAYVFVKGAAEYPKAGDPKWAAVVVTSINTGRTPALNGQFEYILEHRDTPVPEETVVNQRDWSGHRIVFPPSLEVTTGVGMIETDAGGNSGGPPKGPRKSPAAAGDATASSIAGAAPGGVSQPESAGGNYVYGLIEYDDVFKVHHWTKFCFFHAPETAGWSRCSTFNASD
jgi:hypothetical protein